MTKHVKTEDFKAYASESAGLERDYIGELVNSRRTAWTVAKIAGGLAALSLVAVAGLAPLKEKEPYVVLTSAETGATEIVARMKDAQTTYGENVDKHFLNGYVLRRESYDYNTLENDYKHTALLSTADVQKQYFAIYSGPTSKEKVLKNTVRTLVTIKSITPNEETGTAVVRFRTQDHFNDLQTDVPKDWIATVAYSYVNAEMSDKDRRDNPLGFQVSSYRVDPETVSSQ